MYFKVDMEPYKNDLQAEFGPWAANIYRTSDLEKKNVKYHMDPLKMFLIRDLDAHVSLFISLD